MEVRSPNQQPPWQSSLTLLEACFGFRISAFFRISGFALRISALPGLSLP